jgi:hypothetical protein
MKVISLNLEDPGPAVWGDESDVEEVSVVAKLSNRADNVRLEVVPTKSEIVRRGSHDCISGIKLFQKVSRSVESIEKGY